MKWGSPLGGFVGTSWAPFLSAAMMKTLSNFGKTKATLIGSA